MDAHNLNNLPKDVVAVHNVMNATKVTTEVSLFHCCERTYHCHTHNKAVNRFLPACGLPQRNVFCRVTGWVLCDDIYRDTTTVILCGCYYHYIISEALASIRINE